jgi:hypothetical protein
MELPNDIWDIIVKQSKKTNEDIIADLTLIELRKLEIVIAEKKTKLYNAIKSKLDKYDVIRVNDVDYIIINKNIKKDCCIRVCELTHGYYKTIFGKYVYGKMYNQNLCLFNSNITILSKWEHRCRENINIANTLKVGDVFAYSIYTGCDWVKMRNRIYEMENFNDGIQYGVVELITANKIVMYNYWRDKNNPEINDFKSVRVYIDKNVILNKINWGENQDGVMKKQKHKFIFKCFLEIKNITDIADYFENVNKKQLIKLQKKLKIR